LPLGTLHAAFLDNVEAFLVGQIQALPVTAEQVQTATRRDPVLSKVFCYVEAGWPERTEEIYKPFAQHKQELSIQAECLLWGNLVIIPTKLRSCLIEELHKDHPGASHMKSVV